MSNLGDVALLVDIARAAERILTFTGSIDAVAFREDARTHLAVQHQLMVIGEAAKRLTPEIRAKMNDVPWSAVARLRDRLIHGYDTVDLEIVWDTVQTDVPSLLRYIRQYLDDEHGSKDEGE